MKNVDVEAMNQVYDQGKMNAEIKLQKLQNDIEAIREESKSIGAIEALRCVDSHTELLRYAAFYNIKKSKGYKKGGMSWQDFCDVIGEPRKTIEDKLKDIRPLVEKVTADFASFARVPFNKIRYLGRMVLADSAKIDKNDLIFDGKKIPLTPDNKEEIASVIDTLIETHKQEKQNLKKSLEKQKSNTGKIINEETKGLKVERDALVKEVERLKPYDIEEKDVKWSVEHLKKMERLCSEFDFAARHFVMDERLKEDIHLMAKASQLIGFMNRYTSDLKKMWDEDFRPYDAM